MRINIKCAQVTTYQHEIVNNTKYKVSKKWQNVQN